jgi:hypothetical protein
LEIETNQISPSFESLSEYVPWLASASITLEVEGSDPDFNARAELERRNPHNNPKRSLKNRKVLKLLITPYRILKPKYIAHPIYFPTQGNPKPLFIWEGGQTS